MYFLLRSFIRTPPPHWGLYLAEEAALCLSLSFLFRALTSLDSFFLILCSHSKLETLKISGRKGSLSLFGDARWLKMLFQKRERERDEKRKSTEKWTRKKTSKKRNPRGHIRITFKPRFTPLRHFFSPPRASLESCSFCRVPFERNQTRNRMVLSGRVSSERPTETTSMRPDNNRRWPQRFRTYKMKKSNKKKEYFI